MGYYIDLVKISMDEYRKTLLNADLLRSRAFLRDDIEQHFEQIKAQSISNLAELLERLKTKKKIESFVHETGLNENYITVLVRELKSNLPKPNKFVDFPILSSDIVSKLEKQGIKNTVQLFDYILSPTQRTEFSKKSDIDEATVLKLTQLTDLSRTRWVNHTFASMLYNTSCNTTEKLAKADYRVLYKEIAEVNVQKQMYKGNLGERDMKFCIDAAQIVPLDIKY